MGSENPEVSLRVLYTVNTSPQYILAKAPHKIALLPADSASSSSSPKHGRASVKACAMAICRSSPELRPDATKDFSVYILDPLEDLISKSRLGQSGGVAVGMGLLSGMLSPYTPDTILVTGTFVGCGQSDDALEVVISLRQVAPPVIRSFDDHSHVASGLSRTKSCPKRSNNDQPYLTSNPRPLPSLDERLFASYVQPHQYESQGSRPKEPRRPNPTHSTRAHQLPTPYIGPPKRRYMKESVQSKEQAADGSTGGDFTAGSSSSQPSPASDKTSDDGSAEPFDSQTSTISSDVESPAPSSSLQSCPLSETPDLTEAAVMLAALSSVSSKPSDSNGTSTVQGKANPNPDLVSFLRAYLAALESQQQSDDTSESVPSATQPGILPSQPPANVLPTASGSVVPVNTQNKFADKENQKPSPAIQSSNNLRPTGSGNTSPLGSGHLNARAPDNRSLTAKASEKSQSLFESNVAVATISHPNDYSRKRKLSNATLSEQSLQARRRSSSSSKGRPHVEDLSGIRVNTGWGGLRVRSDGSLWGEHLPQIPAPASSSSTESGEQPLQQPSFFRSSGKAALTLPVRKGPYVVPDWAKGVPPPAPPPRSELSNEGKDQDRKREKKRSNSNGLGRLGGRGTVRRTASIHKGSRAPTTPPRSASPVQCAPNESITLRSPNASPKETAGRFPILAYSSPVGKSTFASFFQAFQTSPCRPASARKNPLATPLRPSATSPVSSAKHSSLFTPSPVTTKLGSGFRPRKLFAVEDPPPSPTPTKKLSKTSEALGKQWQSRTSVNPEPSSNTVDEDPQDPPSSLPIASSDDLMDDTSSILPPSVSSDSTIMNLSKVHDWSSLDLPPSSPPPPSSPSIVPMEESDLPCSDIPSSDISEVESPPVAFDVDSSNYPSPADGEGQTNLSESCENNVLEYGINLGYSNESMPEPFAAGTFPPFDMSEEEGPSANAALDALRNGLGGEDFSEAWNLIQSLFDQSAPSANMNSDATLDMQVQDWLATDSGSTAGFDFDPSLIFGVESGTVGPAPDAYSGEDPASMVASNFENLLKGCVV